jgi:hypothetical protein
VAVPDWFPEDFCSEDLDQQVAFGAGSILLTSSRIR